jgi:hypothetical protein
VGDDHDRDLGPELGDGLFDPTGGRRVERRARLVHQQHPGPDGQRPGDAQPLLLAAGEGGAGTTEAVLHLVPQAGTDEAPFHQLAALRLGDLGVGQGQPGGDVLGDGHGREGVGLLEHHPDVLADVGEPVAGGVDVVTVEPDLAGQLGTGHRFVHPVEDPQKGRLPAAGGADERGHRGGRHGQGDVVEYLGVAEPGGDLHGIELGRATLGRRPGRRRGRRRPGGAAPGPGPFAPDRGVVDGRHAYEPARPTMGLASGAPPPEP